MREQFSKAKLRGVANSGSVAPIEEVPGRSDVAPLNRMLWPSISKKVKGLAVFPKDNNCQDSKIFEIQAGMAWPRTSPCTWNGCARSRPACIPNWPPKNAA